MNEKKSKQVFITKGNLLKVILVLALPVIFNNFVLELYQTIDSFFAKSLGDTGLAVISFTSPIIGLLLSVSSAISIATTSLTARYLGKNNYKNARRTVAQILGITMICSILLTLTGLLFSYQIIKGLKASLEYLDLAVLYFKYNIAIIPLKFIGDIFFSYKAARGETLHTMIISFLGMAVKLIISIILIEKLQLGVLGMGLATLGSYSVVLIAAVYDMFIKKSEFTLKIDEFKPLKTILLPFLIMIIPLVIEKTTFSFSHVLVNMLITPFDKSVIAAYGLSNRINSLIFAVPNALGSVTITIVAQNLTSGNEDRNKKTILLAHIISFILGAILLMVLYVFHEDIISLFSKDSAEIKETIRAQRLYSHTVFSWAVMQITMGVFYASGYSFIPIIIGVARLFVFRIPTLYLLITFTNLGADSIWYCMLIANNLAGILSLIFLFTINWQKQPKYLNLQQEKQSA